MGLACQGRCLPPQAQAAGRRGGGGREGGRAWQEEGSWWDVSALVAAGVERGSGRKEEGGREGGRGGGGRGDEEGELGLSVVVGVVGVLGARVGWSRCEKGVEMGKEGGMIWTEADIIWKCKKRFDIIEKMKERAWRADIYMCGSGCAYNCVRRRELKKKEKTEAGRTRTEE